jgi:acyl carrier protein
MPIMDSVSVINKINDFLVDEFEVDREEIEAGKDLMKTLELDSLDLVDLVVIIEKNFGFKVQKGDFANLKTFEDFYSYVISKIS